MSIKTLETAVRACALTAAVAWSGGAFAAGAAGDFYSFEAPAAGTALADASLSGLTGNGTVKSENYTYSAAIGKPLPGAAHTQVLEIAGTVAYTNLTSFENTANASQVDFMFKVEATDELESITDNTVQTALAVGETNAVGNTAPIKLWCKVAGANTWLTLCNANTGAWVRASLAIDYSLHRVRVSIDGDPVIASGAVSNAWYALANNGSQSYLKTITMVGSTMIDDLVITNAALAAYTTPGSESATVPASSSGVNVPYSYMEEYGVTRAQVMDDEVLNDRSGMKISEKFQAGLDPKSDTKFELKTMQMSAGSVTVTFPGMNAGNKYSVKAKSSRTGEAILTGATPTKTDSTGENVNSATVTIPAEKQDQLLYFTVETVNP